MKGENKNNNIIEYGVRKAMRIFFRIMDWIGKWKSEKRKNVLKYDVLLFNFVLLIKPSFHTFLSLGVCVCCHCCCWYLFHAQLMSFLFRLGNIQFLFFTSLEECSKIKRKECGVLRLFCELITREWLVRNFLEKQDSKEEEMYSI